MAGKMLKPRVGQRKKQTISNLQKAILIKKPVNKTGFFINFSVMNRASFPPLAQ